LLTRLFALALVAALSWSAVAGDRIQGDIAIGHGWSRPTVEGMGMGVGYVILTNRGKSPDALVSASTPAAESVEFHESLLVDGMSRMRPRSEIPLPAGATVKLEPGGLHLMLVGLKASLKDGTRVPLTLEFRKAGRVTIELDVGNPPAL
jgi:copper(I)-binding protein